MASGTAPRSSRSTIRSAALIATSVPVPRAMPRSAAASAGAVVDPVADHGHPVAARLQFADHGDLLIGQRPGDHLVGADLGARPPARWPALSPVSSTVRRPRRRSPVTAAAAVGLMVSAMATRRAASPSQPASTTVRPACSCAGAAAGQPGRDVHAQVGEQARAADDHVVAVHGAAGAQAGHGQEPAGCGQRPQLGPWPPR